MGLQLHRGLSSWRLEHLQGRLVLAVRSGAPARVWAAALLLVPLDSMGKSMGFRLHVP